MRFDAACGNKLSLHSRLSLTTPQRQLTLPASSDAVGKALKCPLQLHKERGNDYLSESRRDPTATYGH